ncbi:MAG TPA: BON domain-containing protein [Aquabacterium sp.]|nr:BON domain-containing protein [Aquabacterium sp.]
MRTDAELKQDVIAELAWDPLVKTNQIGVAVRDGVVTVSGHLDTYAQKWAVEKAIHRIEGVKAVALELDVRLARDHQRNDTDIAIAAENALKWHALVPAESIRVTVNEGHLTVEGEVQWDYQRQGVEDTLRVLKGVKSLNNQITLKQAEAPRDLRDRIRDAMTRHAIREANHLQIEFFGGVLTLTGTVHSWQEAKAAQGAVWSAPGVLRVVNQLVIE